jgi:hypothetical protein
VLGAPDAANGSSGTAREPVLSACAVVGCADSCQNFTRGGKHPIQDDRPFNERPVAESLRKVTETFEKAKSTQRAAGSSYTRTLLAYLSSTCYPRAPERLCPILSKGMSLKGPYRSQYATGG